MRAVCLALIALPMASPASAGEFCFVPYSEFEDAVPHVDIATCPGAEMEAEAGFCRLAITGNVVHVYQFRNTDGDACLEQVESLPFAQFAERHGTRYVVD